MDDTTVNANALAELSEHVFDTLIIGGGPGGLTAAIYLRRFTRNIAVVDKGNSRLCLIPVSHNYPGFPEGVPGSQLLVNLTNQLRNYGGDVLRGEITALRLEDGIFTGDFLDEAGETRQIRALTVLLATGVADGGLPIENWNEAVLAGAVRLCPVCDGYDVRDKRIAVVTNETNPVGHALFMRSFSADVTLFDRSKEPMLNDEQRRQIEVAGVRYIESPLLGVTMSPDMKPILNTADGESREFDVFYPMLGESARSKLACELGAETGDCDKLIVDDHQRTNVPGLYAIGDVVQGLNQIAVAAGQAAIAATTIHNALPWALRPPVEAKQAA
ncbi:MAG: thioredoxin reductase [Massilia sp.]|jgi:thioredoxin reductase (NADPH)